MTVLSSRFTRAVDHARIAHAAQVRKGSGTPYLYHLLSVAGLVLDYGGDEDQAIAGLLHDVLEDCGSGHEALIRAEFGSASRPSSGTARTAAPRPRPRPAPRKPDARTGSSASWPTWTISPQNRWSPCWSAPATSCTTPAPFWPTCTATPASPCSTVSPPAALAPCSTTRRWPRSCCAGPAKAARASTNWRGSWIARWARCMRWRERSSGWRWRQGRCPARVDRSVARRRGSAAAPGRGRNTGHRR